MLSFKSQWRLSHAGEHHHQHLDQNMRYKAVVYYSVSHSWRSPNIKGDLAALKSSLGLSLFLRKTIKLNSHPIPMSADWPSMLGVNSQRRPREVWGRARNAQSSPSLDKSPTKKKKKSASQQVAGSALCVCVCVCSDLWVTWVCVRGGWCCVEVVVFRLLHFTRWLWMVDKMWLLWVWATHMLLVCGFGGAGL